jgi:histidine ammonia-lyase
MRTPAQPHTRPQPDSTVTFGQGRISIQDIVAIADAECQTSLSTQAEFREKITKGSAFLDKLLQEEGVIYGVTTGYGDSCTVIVPADLVDELPLHLTRFHGCGMGNYFDRRVGRAILAARMTSLTQGYSGVRMILLEQLQKFLNLDLVPVIPEEGSVGASGDLTPLSYVAAALMGERQVYYHGKVRNTDEALREAGLQPIQLKPKEGLAIMNGTAVMTAIACLAYDRAAYLVRLASRITSLASLALKGNGNHFDDLLFLVKPHPGQNEVAAWIRQDINHHEHPRNSDRIQDRYSIRCAPHVIGVLNDSLPWMKQMIENELNSANDNPIIDGLGEHVLHGGHFYGGHIAFVMDSMKNCIANLADLMDRQMALLVDPKFNNGLPANLTGVTGRRKAINHGMKAVQIAVSAWTAEALKNTMPASVFSRSTECHNQDKVSMGTIAARDCLRNLQLTEQVAAAALLAACQALELRIQSNELNEQTLSAEIQAMKKDIFGSFEFITEDRPLESTLRKFVELIQNKHWPLYPKAI